MKEINVGDTMHYHGSSGNNDYTFKVTDVFQNFHNEIVSVCGFDDTLQKWVSIDLTKNKPVAIH